MSERLDTWWRLHGKPWNWRFKPNAFPLNSVTAMVGAFPFWMVSSVSSVVFFCYFLFTVSWLTILAAVKDHVWCPMVFLKHFILEIFSIILSVLDFAEWVFQFCAAHLTQSEHSLYQALENGKRELLILVLETRTEVPTPTPLFSRHHLCVGFSHSPGILCLRMHGADKGCSVSVSPLRWPPLKAPILWGEGSRFGS